MTRSTSCEIDWDVYLIPDIPGDGEGYDDYCPEIGVQYNGPGTCSDCDIVTNVSFTAIVQSVNNQEPIGLGNFNLNSTNSQNYNPPLANNIIESFNSVILTQNNLQSFDETSLIIYGNRDRQVVTVCISITCMENGDNGTFQESECQTITALCQ